MLSNLKKIADDNYECEWDGPSHVYDYSIRKEKRYWHVDGFNSKIRNHDAAHVGSDRFGTFQGAIDFILTDGFRS